MRSLFEEFVSVFSTSSIPRSLSLVHRSIPWLMRTRRSLPLGEGTLAVHSGCPWGLVVGLVPKDIVAITEVEAFSRLAREALGDIAKHCIGLTSSWRGTLGPTKTG